MGGLSKLVLYSLMCSRVYSTGKYETVELCPVCSDFTNGMHYGILTCESCKSFFKRSVTFEKSHTFKCDSRTKNCSLTPRNRTSYQYLCPICGDVTSGIHYGARTCESCKLFFKRTIQLERENAYNCTGGRSCVVNVQTRAWCKLCRFNKCLNSGMKVGMVKKSITPRYSWSRQGNAIIILGEHRFKKRSKHINQRHETHWVCNKCDKGCKAKLTTINDAIIKMYNIHDHRGLRKAK